MATNAAPLPDWIREEATVGVCLSTYHRRDEVLPAVVARVLLTQVVLDDGRRFSRRDLSGVSGTSPHYQLVDLADPAVQRTIAAHREEDLMGEVRSAIDAFRRTAQHDTDSRAAARSRLRKTLPELLEAIGQSEAPCPPC